MFMVFLFISVRHAEIYSGSPAKIFPVTLCVECQAYQEKTEKTLCINQKLKKILFWMNIKIYRRHNQINNILAYCALVQDSLYYCCVRR